MILQSMTVYRCKEVHFPCCFCERWYWWNQRRGSRANQREGGRMERGRKSWYCARGRRFYTKLIQVLFLFTSPLRNRPLALTGHVTNASSKQWVGILLMPKTDRAHKNYLTAEIWEEKHLREIFYGTLIFQQRSMICIARHVGGHTLALQHGGENYFLLISF